MKAEKNKIQWLPIIIIVWNLIDIAVHVAVDMVEVLRVSGNVLAIAVTVVVLNVSTKKWTHDVLLGSAGVVVILNSIFLLKNGTFMVENGFLVPMLVFVGVTVFLLIRWAQVKRLEYMVAVLANGEELDIRFYHQWWMAFVLTIIGILITALFGIFAG